MRYSIIEAFDAPATTAHHPFAQSHKIHCTEASLLPEPDSLKLETLGYPTVPETNNVSAKGCMSNSDLLSLEGPMRPIKKCIRS